MHTHHVVMLRERGGGGAKTLPFVCEQLSSKLYMICVHFNCLFVNYLYNVAWSKWSYFGSYR